MTSQPETAFIPDTPLECIVDKIQKCVTLAKSTGADAALQNALKDVLDLAQGLDPYFSLMATPPSGPLKDLHQRTLVEPWMKDHQEGKTKFKLTKEMVTGHVEGATLKTLVQMTGARRVLEIGMFTGYGALAMAEGLPNDGKVIACEIEPYLKTFAWESFKKSPHSHKIDVRIGPALETIKNLADEKWQFDLVFIDADKTGYMDYYKTILDRHLLDRNGTLCVDNALLKGLVYLDPSLRNESASAIAEFNEFVRKDDRVEHVMLPTRDGILLVRHKDQRPTEVTQGSKTLSPVDDVMTGLHNKSILQRFRLDGKVALVTGAGQGIGRAFAHTLGEAGACVAVCDLDKSRSDKVKGELLQKGIDAISVACDVSKASDVTMMVKTIVDKWGSLHIACNNAGINLNSASEDTTTEEWDKTMDVNLRGVFLCCQGEAKVMLKQKYGRIINTASMSTLIVPHPQKQVAYNVSKAGVVNLTKTLGAEWADRGIRVNAISPGIVDTPLIHSEALAPLSSLWLKDIPVGRFAKVTDLQGALLLLASDTAEFMTGHNLVVDGGQSLY